MRTIKGLTGLRFFAAFYVFIFHIDMHTPLTYLPWRIQTVIQEGRLGVTLFFVLSGFVLTYSHLKDFTKFEFKGWNYLGKFIYKRLARIYPVYLVGLILCVVTGVLFNNLPNFKVIFLNATFLQTYFPNYVWLWYGSGAWSVSNEVFFYLLFPFSLSFLILFKKSWQLFLLIGILTLFCTFIDLVGSGNIPRFFPFPYTWAYWFPPLRFPEFLIGMLTALLVFRFNLKIPDWVAIFFLFASVIYLSYFGPLFSGTLTHNWIIIPTIVFLLSTLSQPKQSVFFKWLESKPLQYFGQVSYAFYIFQLPSLIILDELIKLGKIDKTNILVLPVTITLNLIGAILIHELIEKKAHSLLMNFLSKRNPNSSGISNPTRIYSKV